MDYCRRKTTGTLKRVRTALPCCLPGFHLGMLLTTRRASLSSAGSTLFLISTLATEPSRSTMKPTVTRP